MRLSIATLGLPLLLVAAGCTTMGAGTGSTPSGTDQVNFSWKSSDSVSGTMNASLADGTIYSGQFFQVTRDTTVDNLSPLWAGWGRGPWGYGWNDWGAGPSFITRSEEHTSELQSPDQLVCRLLLEKKKLLPITIL